MDNQDLIKRIEELEKWKAQREQQQITYPLDVNSQVILGKYFMHIVSAITTVGGAAGHEFTTYLGQQGQINFQIGTENDLVSYTVNVSTDYLTVSSYLRFFNDTAVVVATEDTAPSPLVVGTTYYVINSDGTTFQLSATMGGAAINITDTGTGRQFITYA